MNVELFISLWLGGVCLPVLIICWAEIRELARALRITKQEVADLRAIEGVRGDLDQALDYAFYGPFVRGGNPPS